MGCHTKELSLHDGYSAHPLFLRAICHDHRLRQRLEVLFQLLVLQPAFVAALARQYSIVRVNAVALGIACVGNINHIASRTHLMNQRMKRAFDREQQTRLIVVRGVDLKRDARGYVERVRLNRELKVVLETIVEGARLGTKAAVELAAGKPEKVAERFDPERSEALAHVALQAEHAKRRLIGLLAFGAFIEISQSTVAYRSAEWFDMLANGVGIGVGLTIALIGAGGWCLRFENRFASVKAGPGGD